ncbi:MAG: triose-phosphate isomerase [Halothiobacillaceae bacterium]
MRKPIVLGNWKMNGSLSRNAEVVDGLHAGLEGLDGVEIGICPPFVYLPQVGELLRGQDRIGLGAQDCSEYQQGAYTGEVSACMLAEFGVKYVILGHSERRALFAEDDQVAVNKVRAVMEGGITPVLCVGETLEERESDQTEEVVGRQVEAALDGLGVEAFDNLVIAYEPVWAIGTGKTATPEKAQAVHAFIRGLVASRDAAVADRLRIQYGGSMKPGNAADLIAQPDIDGGLIGGASLKAEDFLAICRAAASSVKD